MTVHVFLSRTFRLNDSAWHRSTEKQDKLLRGMTNSQLVRSQLESGSSKPHVTSNNTCKSSSQKVENRRRFNVVSRPAAAYAVNVCHDATKFS